MQSGKAGTATTAKFRNHALPLLQIFYKHHQATATKISNQTTRFRPNNSNSQKPPFLNPFISPPLSSTTPFPLPFPSSTSSTSHGRSRELRGAATPPARSKEESRSCHMRTSQEEARRVRRHHQCRRRRFPTGETRFRDSQAEKKKHRKINFKSPGAGEARRPPIMWALRF